MTPVYAALPPSLSPFSLPFPVTTAHPSDTILIRVNGQDRHIPAATTLRGLIELCGLGQAACAAEVNRTLVPKRDHTTRILAQGDSVELVSLVGGG